MIRRLTSGICGVLLTISPLFAQNAAPDKPATDSGQVKKPAAALNDRLDFHIDSWARGQITAIDTAKGTLSLKGENMPYATAYAKMLREIHDQTADVTDINQKQTKESNIRESWQAKLDTAVKEVPEKDKTFELRAPEGKTMDIFAQNQVNDLDYLHKDRELAAATPALNESDKSLAAPVIDNSKNKDQSASGDTNRLLMTDLKVGDNVMIGFDAGLIHNDGYAIIRCSSDKLPEKTDVK